ncbi:MAG: hypothetical protein MJB14_07930 [Spirochaetes bacterium]|nr:hypothetical protein [Spirochaetota bacterium]
MNKLLSFLLLLILTSCSRDPLAEVRRIAISKKTENKEEAAKHYDTVIETLTKAYASNGLLNKELGRRLMLEKQFQPAIKHFLIAKDIRSDDSWIYYWIAVCYANLFKIEKNLEDLDYAEKYYQIALNLKPNEKEFLYGYASLLVFGKENYIQAIDILKNLIFQLQYKDPNAYFLLGRSYFILGMYADAYQIYGDIYQFEKMLTDDQKTKLAEFIETTRGKLTNE